MHENEGRLEGGSLEELGGSPQVRPSNRVEQFVGGRTRPHLYDSSTRLVWGRDEEVQEVGRPVLEDDMDVTSVSLAQEGNVPEE